MYNAKEVCEILKISKWTLINWYQWQRIALEKNELKAEVLPIPIKAEHETGKPRLWTTEQVDVLKEFQKSIIKGKNGFMGRVTNPKSRQAKNRV